MTNNSFASSGEGFVSEQVNQLSDTMSFSGTKMYPGGDSRTVLSFVRPALQFQCHHPSRLYTPSLPLPLSPQIIPLLPPYPIPAFFGRGAVLQSDLSSRSSATAGVPSCLAPHFMPEVGPPRVPTGSLLREAAVLVMSVSLVACGFGSGCGWVMAGTLVAVWIPVLVVVVVVAVAVTDVAVVVVMFFPEVVVRGRVAVPDAVAVAFAIALAGVAAAGRLNWGVSAVLWVGSRF